MAGFTKRRHYNKNPQRRKIPGVGSEERRPRRTPIVPTTVGPNASAVVPIVFDGPVFVVEGVVPGLSIGSFACTNATQVNPNTVNFTFGGLGPWSGDVIIPFEDRSVRNTAGGFMQPGTYVQEEA